MMQLNREQRRALKKAKPPRKGSGYIELPITMRHDRGSELDLMLVPQLSSDRMRDGTASEPDWHTLVMRLNWARVLNRENFEDGGEIIANAQAVMVQVKGTNSLTIPQYDTVTTALTMANQMQTACTRRELRDSLEAMHGANQYLLKKQEIQDRLDGR